MTSDGELAFEVEKIVRLTGYRRDGRIIKDKAIVKWVGYSEDYNTILKIQDLMEDCPYLIRDYVRSQRPRPILPAHIQRQLDALPDAASAPTLNVLGHLYAIIFQMS